jgi:hypothetical protein
MLEGVHAAALFAGFGFGPVLLCVAAICLDLLFALPIRTPFLRGRAPERLEHTGASFSGVSWR